MTRRIFVLTISCMLIKMAIWLFLIIMITKLGFRRFHCYNHYIIMNFNVLDCEII